MLKLFLIIGISCLYNTIGIISPYYHNCILISIFIYLKITNINLKKEIKLIKENTDDLNMKIMKNIKDIYLNDINDKNINMIIEKLNLIINIIDKKWYNNKKLTKSCDSINNLKDYLFFRYCFYINYFFLNIYILIFFCSKCS